MVLSSMYSALYPALDAAVLRRCPTSGQVWEGAGGDGPRGILVKIPKSFFRRQTDNAKSLSSSLKRNDVYDAWEAFFLKFPSKIVSRRLWEICCLCVISVIPRRPDLPGTALPMPLSSSS